MTTWEAARLAPVCGLLCAPPSSILVASVSDYAVPVSATVQTNPARITLYWLADPNATSYTLYRKSRDAADWGRGVVLAADATSCIDSNVTSGGAYEYWIAKNASTYFGDGYIYSGIEVPLVESRGKVVLLVDNTYAISLSRELACLQQDLVGDGWIVLRHEVARMAVDPADTSSNVWAARSNELAIVKGIIKGDYDADPTNLKAVFLFGHVPVPYSGDMAPDDHYCHVGAWPADAFYGDMEGTWTDLSVICTDVGDQRTRNVPGDGKLDQTDLPSDLALQVGRVDFANLPAFPVSEGELLRRYLNKDHNFRHKVITAERRGLIDDHLGIQGGWEAFAANGWRTFAPFFGATNSFASSDWFGTLSTNSYLWGYGCGGGTYTSASGVGSTADFVNQDPQVVFTMFFGSYFGDWDSQDNFMRAALGTTNYTLASVWAGRPFWIFHHMALGETIGFSARVTQNNNSSYSADLFSYYTHVALMGDPTLRMHIVAPPSGLLVTSNGSGGVDLSWNASPDAVLGYHVYRAPKAAGPFTRLNTDLITGTSFPDPEVTTNVYMVRAVNLEVSASGSYYNASQGIFQDLANDFGLPMLTITGQSTNKAYGAPMPAFTALYSGFTNGDTPASLSSLPLLTTPATTASPAGHYPIWPNGARSSNYTIRYLAGTLAIDPAVTTGVLSSSTNPAFPGQPIVFTLALNVVAPGTGTPTGTVQFDFDGTNAVVTDVSSAGAASVTNGDLTHGWHTVTAEYGGDGNFIGTTNSLTLAQLINTPPVAGPNTIQRDPANGAKVSITALMGGASDADGDPITFLGASPTGANGSTVVRNGGWIVYTPVLGFASADTFTYTIADSLGAAATGLVTVDVRLDHGPPASLAVGALRNGSFVISGEGVRDRTYRIVYAQDPGSTDWQDLVTATADPSGTFEFLDTTKSTQRFYRAVYP